MTAQLEQAKRGRMTPQIEAVARAEGIDPGTLLSRVASAEAVVMCRGGRAVGIGRGLGTKVNVNIGTSPSRIDPDEEVRKAVIAERYGADTITDLSTGGDIEAIRQRVFQATTVPITTVPIYQTAAQKGIGSMTADDILATIAAHAREGVSSVVLHCAGRDLMDVVRRWERIMGVVSKGGAITLAYMRRNRCENPFLEHFDEVLRILRRYDVVLSLGNSMRSGCIHDVRDAAQAGEMQLNARLAREAYERDVQTIIEGVGGHVRADRIAPYVKQYKDHSPAPLFVAGPLPTDVAVGHDHIAGCVGASIASGAGADYLCYITPSEHIGLPGPEEVKEGLIAFRIAAHIGDTIKYGRDDPDRDLAERRARLDWKGQAEYAIDREALVRAAPGAGPCTMCGDFCALKLMREP
ncbi:MAG: phosphomethylpyrimidine synthase ThiC [Methanomicrobiales archaeon]|nr:phosphomethylpyrimidine synthase ThiC [Methanomicrobiales archaeon]MDI6876956.1 phosphomethylpyrimidine synthase ThiC [Methanomicrobiales archaeon]